jgi:citrate synthase
MWVVVHVDGQIGANERHSTGKDELLETAMALHDAAMKDEYFIKRKLAPNVDFW